MIVVACGGFGCTRGAASGGAEAGAGTETVADPLGKPLPPVEKVAPSPIAFADPKTVSWPEQGLSFRVPGDWQVRDHSRTTFSFKPGALPGEIPAETEPAVPAKPQAPAAKAGSRQRRVRTVAAQHAPSWKAPSRITFVTNVTLLPASTSIDGVLRTTYKQATAHERRFDLGAKKLRYIETQGLRGILTEDGPAESGASRTIQWTAYRPYDGDVQMIVVSAMTTGESFDRDAELLRALIYSVEAAGH